MAGTRVIIRFSSGVNGVALPQLADAGLDARVLGFAFAVSLCTGVLFGLAPALRASRAALDESLKEGSLRVAGGKRHRRLSGLLVLSEE